MLSYYDGNLEEITLRVGISFVSTDQACANAEEIGLKSFEEIMNTLKGLWNEKLRRVEVVLTGTPADINRNALYLLVPGVAHTGWYSVA